MFKLGGKQAVKRHGVGSFVTRYFRLLRFYLVTGLLVWIPLIVTVWLTWWLFETVGLGIESLIESGYGNVQSLGERFAFFAFLQHIEYRLGFGFMLALFLFLLTGIFARNLIGRRLIHLGERFLNQIPLIRNVYQAVKQIRDVFVNREGAVFQKVCIVEYPRKGSYAVAFVTSEEQGIVQKTLERKLISVFIPTTPNPTSGFLLYVRAEEITIMDITVEEAMKLIVSGGAYQPDLHGRIPESPVPLASPQ